MEGRLPLQGNEPRDRSDDMPEALTELRGAERETVRRLFTGLGHHLSLQSVLDGTNPGRVFADRAVCPTTALVVSTEGTYLAGEAADEACVAAVRGTVGLLGASGYETLWLDVDPPAWDERLGELFANRTVRRIARRHYTCTAVRRDRDRSLPTGYSVRPLDGALLADAAVKMPAHVQHWVETNWGSRETFLRLGFACCTMWGSEVVSWCVCDCVSGEACEVGIHTAEAHRRRGLAAATAAAATEDALRRGFRVVGWHCDDANVGSWRTAERVGFTRGTDYVFRYCTL
jgi:GNAT superfamily N-acetyltransferase